MGETQKRIESTTVDRPSPISAYNEQDDDRIFALLCARANAKTDDDAHAIAWAEDEIASLRKECASVSEIANNLDAENYRLSSELEKARDMLDTLFMHGIPNGGNIIVTRTEWVLLEAEFKKLLARANEREKTG